MGITEGPFKVDYLHDTRYGQPFIIETATRWSGGFDHTHSAPLARGIDFTGFMLDYAVGGVDAVREKLPDICLWPGDKIDKVACVYAPQYPPGQIDDWRIPDTVYDDGGLSDVIIRNRGFVPTPVSCADRPLFIITHGPDSETALNNAKRAAGQIKPVYKEGAN